MSLARGEDPIQAGPPGAPTEVEALTVVIAISPSIEERVRLAQLINGSVPVLLVSSREEAVALLGGGDPPPQKVSVLTSSPVAPSASASLAPAVAPPSVTTTVLEPLPPRGSRSLADGSSGLDIDSDWRIATWRDNSVSLSPLEHDLLSCLLEEVGRTLTFEWLHQRVWGNDHLGGRSDLQSVVKRLRRKLRDLGSPLQIHAVRGVGLRLTDLRGLPGSLPPTVALPGPRGGALDDLPA